MYMKIPITVFTGFLGAGKTSIILSLLPKLPKDYKVVLLKNEFGDVEVDSQLARLSSLVAVSEISNGCVCCVLVGQMRTALLEIRDKYHPDRIIIECSGSAFPAGLAFQIRELTIETELDFVLDAIVTVIDAENFAGYEDTSSTARLQAEFSDLLLINKWEHVSERQLDIVIDHLNTLNEYTPKIRCNGRDGVDPNIIFGVDTQLFLSSQKQPGLINSNHHDEVEAMTIYKGTRADKPKHKHRRVHYHDEDGEVFCDCGKDMSESDENEEEEPEDFVDEPEETGTDVGDVLNDSVLRGALATLPETVYRVKGFVRLLSGVSVINWAFQRPEFQSCDAGMLKPGASLLVTVMGERGEVLRSVRKFCSILQAEVV